MASSNARAEIFDGIMALFGRHIVLGLASMFLGWVPFLIDILLLAIMFISFTQLFYAIPLCRKFRKEYRPYAVSGVVIGCILTVFINGACFGFLIWATQPIST